MTIMQYINPHSAYIDKRILDLKKTTKLNTKIIDTTHEDFIKDFSTCLFTNYTRTTFTAPYLKKHPCSDCGKPSKERCHGINEDRPILIKRALEKIYPDITKTITLKEVMIQYLEEHKSTKFTFKCSQCHKNESKNTKD